MLRFSKKAERKDPVREVDESFHSLADWQMWMDEHPDIRDVAFRNRLLAHVTAHGFREPLTGTIVQPDGFDRGGDLREGLVHRGVNCRQRAVLHVIEQTIDMGLWPQLRIYAPEAVTAMALRLRGLFPKFIGSEFTLDEERRRQMYPVALQDLTALTLPSDTFDLVTTNEVLEHVPSIDDALKEIARVLKAGCWHIGTHPLVSAEAGIVKTRLDDGRLVHLMEPEYHGDPFGDSGSLVFELPGWDILRRATAAGFSRAMMRYVISQQHACVTDDTIGVFVLCCQK